MRGRVIRLHILQADFFGKHKLILYVSPNKTVEGSVGGVVGAMVICIVYLLIVKNVFDTNVAGAM